MNSLDGRTPKWHLQHQCPHGRMTSPKWLLLASLSLWESSLPPASPGGSPELVSGSDPGFLQMTASVPSPGVCEILCTPLKSRVSVSYSPLALPYTSPIGLQSHMFWGLVLLVQDPWAGELNVGLRPITSCGKFLQLWLSSHSLATYQWVWVLTIPCLHPYYLSHCDSFFFLKFN